MKKLNEINDKIIKEQEDSIKLLQEISKDNDFIINELKQQLSIHVISQLREQLIAFSLYKEGKVGKINEGIEIYIDSYLKWKAIY